MMQGKVGEAKRYTLRKKFIQCVHTLFGAGTSVADVFGIKDS
jgi:hypothetical protein